MLGWHASGFIDTSARKAAQSTKSAAQILDDFRCPRGQAKIVLMHGMDDNFASAGKESATVRPELLKIARFREMAEDRHAIFAHRNYDEAGVDKFLIDHFDFPRGVLSGIFVTKLRAVGNNESDSITIGQSDLPIHAANLNGEIAYLVNNFDPTTKANAAHGNSLIIQELESMRLDDATQASPKEFLDFVNSKRRPDRIDVIIQDDTMVDYVAFAMCQEPTIPMATTFTEFAHDTGFPDLSYFSCFSDFSQPSCDPFRGNHACTVSAPIACYKDGNRKPPAALKNSQLDDQNFVGGEVRLSRAVRPDSFVTLKAANDFCAAEFGQGARVTTYHEATGSQMISYSNLALRARGIIHVGGQPYGNCWDRPESVLKP